PKPALFAGTPKIDAGYFKTMGIPLLAGRDFTAQDTEAAPKVAIVSERVVREYAQGGPGEGLGRRVRLEDHGEGLTVVGVIADMAGAVAVTRVLQTFLFGVTPTDPIAFTIVTLLLMAVGLMAAWLPARRATRIDPCAALRAE